MEKEIWKNVSEIGIIEDGKGKLVDMSVYTNYMVSNMGNVKSLNYKKTGKEKILKSRFDSKCMYLLVTLCYNGKPKNFLIHRLVAMMFLENPNGYPQINHKDENPTNNNVKNLEFCTAEYNINYGHHNEKISLTRKKSIKCKQNTKKQSKQVFQYTKDLELVRIWESTMEAERNGGFEHSEISNCCLGKNKTHQGFIWSYHPLRKTAVRMGFFGALSINGWKIQKGA